MHSLTGGKTATPENNGQVPLAPSESKMIDEVEKFDLESMFSDPVNLSTIPNLEQRLAQIDIQPSNVLELFPRHKYLMIKRSQRCRKCEHNLSKPEYNPTSIKFKIQLAAFYHIPEVSIFKLAETPFVPGAVCNFVLKLANPTQHPTYVEFIDLVGHMIERKAKEEATEVEDCEEAKLVSFIHFCESILHFLDAADIFGSLCDFDPA